MSITAAAVAPHVAPSTKSIAPDRRSGLSYREFVHEYLLPRRPVILTDATAGWAARGWTPEHLRSALGSREIAFRGAKHPWRFDELVDRILASTDENPAPYARNINVARDLPELLADISPRLAFAQPDWKSSRLLPRDWLMPNGLEELFFGGAGARFPSLHVDYFGMDGFISQLYGDKDFLIFAPEDGKYLYTDSEAGDGLSSTIQDFDNPDFERYPLLAQAVPIRFTLRPGETFYQPNGWWHTTRMPGVSITVITATWNIANWPALIDHYNYFARQGHARPPLKSRICAAYLRTVGRLLAARDRLAGRF